MLSFMSVEQIKQEITVLSPLEQKEVTAFLFHLRHRDESEYCDAVDSRINDRREESWLSPEEFERQLDER
jgi:hypothetical protein